MLSAVYSVTRQIHKPRILSTDSDLPSAILPKIFKFLNSAISQKWVFTEWKKFLVMIAILFNIEFPLGTATVITRPWWQNPSYPLYILT